MKNLKFAAILNIASGKIPGFEFTIASYDPNAFTYFGALLAKYDADFPFIGLVPIWEEWCKNREMETYIKFHGKWYKRWLTIWAVKAARLAYARLDLKEYCETWKVIEK